MASLLVVGTRLLEIRHRHLSLPSTRPQIQRTHNLPRIVLLIHQGLNIRLAIPTLLCMQNRAVLTVGRHEELRANDPRMPGIGEGTVVTSEMTDDVAGRISV